MANSVDHVLGKKNIEYKTEYAPEVLAREPRATNRKLIEVKEDSLPFDTGYDTWHAYEVSFLLDNGAPVVGVMKMIVPATSEFIVESKSFKLYLFSLNMEKMGETKEKAIKSF